MVQAFPEQVGKRLAQMPLDRLNRPDLPPQHSVIPTQLVKRESCRPLLSTEKALRMNLRPSVTKPKLNPCS
jgi:LacI family transcriptional regulator